MKKIIFTIVNAAYMSYANALRQSVILHCKDFDFKIILLEEENRFEGTDIILAKNLSIKDFQHRAFYYNITELATSIKPDSILYFMNEGYDQILYLDPDIVFYSYPHEITEGLIENNVVLTPHTSQIMSTLDGQRPNELDLLRTGTYNLGFVGVKNSPVGREFAEWWSSRLKYLSFEDYLNGQYTDQKWINIAIEVFEDIRVLKHDGYNVAYWNIENRFLSYDHHNKEWAVNGVPLVFFHFSGFKSAIDSISKNQTRASFVSRPELRPLFEKYKMTLDSFESDENIKYSYSTMINGEFITGLQRSIYFHIYITSLYEINISPFKFNWIQIVMLREKFSSKAPIVVHQSDKEKIITENNGLLTRLLFNFLIKNCSSKKFTSLFEIVHLVSNKSNYARIIEAGSKK